MLFRESGSENGLFYIYKPEQPAPCFFEFDIQPVASDRASAAGVAVVRAWQDSLILGH